MFSFSLVSVVPRSSVFSSIVDSSNILGGATDDSRGEGRTERERTEGLRECCLTDDGGCLFILAVERASVLMGRRVVADTATKVRRDLMVVIIYWFGCGLGVALVEWCCIDITILSLFWLAALGSLSGQEDTSCAFVSKNENSRTIVCSDCILI